MVLVIRLTIQAQWADSVLLARRKNSWQFLKFEIV